MGLIFIILEQIYVKSKFWIIFKTAQIHPWNSLNDSEMKKRDERLSIFAKFILLYSFHSVLNTSSIQLSNPYSSFSQPLSFVLTVSPYSILNKFLPGQPVRPVVRRLSGRLRFFALNRISRNFRLFFCSFAFMFSLTLCWLTFKIWPEKFKNFIWRP